MSHWQRSSAREGTEPSTTYAQIIRSSAIIGGATALNVVIGILRTKAMAVLLGPAGVGLLGLYGTIADLTKNLAGLGIHGSGVRQIAEAAATGDSARIAQTVTALRRTTLLLGVLGAVLLTLASDVVSELTFGTSSQAPAVMLLSLVVLFRVISDAQIALVQGMRRIWTLARLGVVASLLGTVLSIGIVYFLRERGVLPSLVAVAAMTLLSSWWFSRKLAPSGVSMPPGDLGRVAWPLLRLGTAFMASGFLTLIAAYAVRTLVLRNFGLNATGLYEAAWTLGGLYVGFILQAMGTDFYPRLVGAAANNAMCNRMVNEQIHGSLLLAAPGVLATLTFAPLVLPWFYSTRFAAATDVLRWICLGMMLRVVTWPIGYIIVAKARQGAFFIIELAWTLAFIGLASLFVLLFGLTGAGIAFCASYVFHALLLYPLARNASGFRFATRTRVTSILYVSLIGTAFAGDYLLSPLGAMLVGTFVTICGALYSLVALLRLAHGRSFPTLLAPVATRFPRIATFFCSNSRLTPREHHEF